MSRPKRHGGHILPEDVHFPPASAPMPEPYGQSGLYRSNNPYQAHSGQSYQPASQYPGSQAPTPSTPQSRKPRHGGTLLPEEHYPEKGSATAETMSIHSKTASNESPPRKRHGGSKTPEVDVDNISQVHGRRPSEHDQLLTSQARGLSLLHAPPQIVRNPPLGHHSPSPSYTTNEKGYANETVVEYPYAVTTNSSQQPLQRNPAPPPPPPHPHAQGVSIRSSNLQEVY